MFRCAATVLASLMLGVMLAGCNDQSASVLQANAEQPTQAAPRPLPPLPPIVREPVDPAEEKARNDRALVLEKIHQEPMTIAELVRLTKADSELISALGDEEIRVVGKALLVLDDKRLSAHVLFVREGFNSATEKPEPKDCLAWVNISDENKKLFQNAFMVHYPGYQVATKRGLKDELRKFNEKGGQDILVRLKIRCVVAGTMSIGDATVLKLEKASLVETD
jgi:hypothetical protein